MVFVHKISRASLLFLSNGLRRVALRDLTQFRQPILNSQTRYLGSITPINFNKAPNEPTDPKSTETKESFDDFRAREEKREEQFEAQYTEEAKKAKEEEEAKAGKAEKDEKERAIKQSILQAALTHVAADGWSKEALVAGCEDLGLDGMAHGIFTRGPAELIDHYNSECNKQLITYMEQVIAERGENSPETPAKFALKAVKYRFKLLEPYKTHWPQACAIMTMPPNVPTALSNLLTMVDDICYYAGDRSVDFNWYTRRIGLASIYKATELFWLQDRSPDHEKTWAFLEHRINDATKIQDILSQSGFMSQNIADAGKSIFDTARNILGLNFNRR